ncbi:hypothetical protein MNL02_06935 [Bartonella krasnovii]|uniref:hypothetical protein n=1 Tax=Bartonella krasnovii TaxID=2267275 RepID=UPI001F4C753A|nr:hypothetical protein [Bartonella krasnovii]UNF51782.1 hypothetical protein MNL02_06935 [Bartonella krasnovii]
MRHNGGNLRSDQELSDQELRSFSLEEMLLTRKNYKIIFCFAFILEAFKVALILLFKWDLTDWWNYSLFIFILILIVLSVLLFLLIPVAFVVRVIFTHLLKKKIAQLEKVIGPRRKIPS